MQRVASSVPGATRAPVGQAEMHAVQSPHWSNPGSSGVEGQARDEAPEEEPRAQLGVDDAAVLADPADAGVLRVDALLNGPGVHVRPRVKRRAVFEAHPLGQCVEPLADDDVVVVAPGVAGDDGTSRIAGVGRVRSIGSCRRWR